MKRRRARPTELVRARDDATKAAAVTRAYLDHENLVGSVFPELVSARAVKLQRRAGELGEEADQQIEAVAAARGRVKGLETRLSLESRGGRAGTKCVDARRGDRTVRAPPVHQPAIRSNTHNDDCASCAAGRVRTGHAAAIGVENCEANEVALVR